MTRAGMADGDLDLVIAAAGVLGREAGHDAALEGTAAATNVRAWSRSSSAWRKPLRVVAPVLRRVPRRLCRRLDL